MPTNSPPLGLSAVPSPKKARRMLPGCQVAEADGPSTAAALGAATALGTEPPALIALAVGCPAPTATRAAGLAPARDTAAAGRELFTPTDAAGASRAARLAATPEGRRATPLFAVADAPRLT